MSLVLKIKFGKILHRIHSTKAIILFVLFGMSSLLRAQTGEELKTILKNADAAFGAGFLFERDLEGGPITHFLFSNERRPAEIINIMNRTGGGVGVAVGTERALIDFVHSNADSMIMADIDGAVTCYNAASIILLKAFSDPAQYFKMKSDPSELDKLLNENDGKIFSNLNVDEIAFLKELVKKRWWKNHWKAETARMANFFSKGPVNSSHVSESSIVFNYENTRYWENMEQYNKLRSAALSGRLSVMQINLSDPKQVNEKLLPRVIENGGLSFVDFSNAWHEGGGYPGGAGIRILLKGLLSAVNERSLAVASWLFEAQYAGFSIIDLQNRGYFNPGATSAELDFRNIYIDLNKPCSILGISSQ